jgi:hypothetical protein
VSLSWIDCGLAALAKKHNPLLEQLGQQGRIRLAPVLGPIDCVDRYSASLIGAALSRQRSICIVLPDANPRRPALLFSYAVMCQWWKNKNLGVNAKRPILYCGAKAGIREQLGQVVITGMSGSLAAVFDQTHLTRGAGVSLAGRTIGTPTEESHLPPVVTAYVPADPRALIERLRPVFVAVDLGDACELDWLSPLQEAATAANSPVLAWSCNPLSRALDQFANGTEIVKWPFARTFADNLAFEKTETADVLFQPFIVTNVNPVFVIGSPTIARDGPLNEAFWQLVRLDRPPSGSLAYKTIQMHWQLLRSLELLVVPHDFYEAEVPKFWGLTSLEKLEEVCDRLRAALVGKDRQFLPLLEKAGELLRVVRASFRERDPPLWSAVISLIHEEPEPKTARLLTVPSRGRKDLLIFALLAKLNITPADLAPLRTWILSVDELRSQTLDCGSNDLWERAIPGALTCRPMLVGLPSALRTPWLWPLFLGEELDVLLYHYQASSLVSRVMAWDSGLSPDLNRFAAAIAHMGPLPQPRGACSLTHRVVLAPASEIAVTAGKPVRRVVGEPPLWEANDEREEVVRLFDVQEANEPIEDLAEPNDVTEAPSAASWVESAYEVAFSGEWFATFPPDAQLNLFNRATSKIEERYVSAVHPGDQVLLIPHQKRQSLYALIISRVHQHQSMALPLALLNRWHSDLGIGVRLWARQAANMPSVHIPTVAELLLRRIREAGSRLTHPLTIQFWLRGLTLCPEDPEDLRRVAEVLSLPFVKQHYRRIANAASRIRGLHRGLSVRLGHWLAEQSGGLQDMYDREIIDPELGLTFGDIRASIVIEKVINIRLLSGTFLRADLGTIRKA